MLALDLLIDHRYRVEQLLGHGGMAAVYLAVDTDAGQPVAVKLLRDDPQSAGAPPAPDPAPATATSAPSTATPAPSTTLATTKSPPTTVASTPPPPNPDDKDDASEQTGGRGKGGHGDD
ncbi:MAG: hypothetical protein ACRDZ0_15240 [Acidimicrobiales bacterium]